MFEFECNDGGFRCYCVILQQFVRKIDFYDCEKCKISGKGRSEGRKGEFMCHKSFSGTIFLSFFWRILMTGATLTVNRIFFLLFSSQLRRSNEVWTPHASTLITSKEITYDNNYSLYCTLLTIQINSCTFVHIGHVLLLCFTLCVHKTLIRFSTNDMLVETRYKKKCTYVFFAFNWIRLHWHGSGILKQYSSLRPATLVCLFATSSDRSFFFCRIENIVNDMQLHRRHTSTYPYTHGRTDHRGIIYNYFIPMYMFICARIWYFIGK